MSIICIPNFFNAQECTHYIKMLKDKQAPNFTDSGQFTNKKWIDLDLAKSFYSRLGGERGCGIDNALYPNKYIMAGHYIPGNSFSIHTDTGLFYDSQLNHKSQWTLLVYLNENFHGGETIFYDTNTWDITHTIKPETGKALIFDIDLWHSGAPVENGEKYWIGCEIIGKIK